MRRPLTVEDRGAWIAYEALNDNCNRRAQDDIRVRKRCDGNYLVRFGGKHGRSGLCDTCCGEVEAGETS